VLPPFTERGTLPPGIHPARPEEIADRFGRFQRSEQRPRLMAILREFIDEVRSSRWIQRLFLAGSFVTAREEPNDIDVLLVFERGAQFIEVLPHEYNVLDQSGALRRFGPAIDLHVVEEDSEAMERVLRFFQRARSGNAVGIVEVTL
jgi:predicted nucleotidyltransferase